MLDLNSMYEILELIVMQAHPLMIGQTPMKAISKRKAMLHTLLRVSPSKIQSMVIPSPGPLYEPIPDCMILITSMITFDWFIIPHLCKFHVTNYLWRSSIRWLLYPCLLKGMPILSITFITTLILIMLIIISNKVNVYTS